MSLNFAELMEEFEEGNGEEGGNGSNFLENFVMMPKDDGVVVVRILPPGNDLPLAHGGLFMSTRVHTINGRKVHCRRERVKGKKYPVGDCRICDHYNWLYRQADACKSRGDKEGMDAYVREARAIKPVERYYFNVIVRKVRKDNGEDEFNVGPKILSIGKTLKDRILRAIMGDEALEEPALGDISDLVIGRDLRIVKKMRHSNGESFPNYDDSKFLDPSPAGTPEQVKVWMSHLHNLHALRIVKTVEEVEREVRIYLGAEQDVKPNTYDPNKLTGMVASPSVAAVAVSQNTVVEDDIQLYNSASLSTQVESGADDPVVSDPVPSVAMDNETFFNTLRNM